MSENTPPVPRDYGKDENCEIYNGDGDVLARGKGQYADEGECLLNFWPEGNFDHARLVKEPTSFLLGADPITGLFRVEQCQSRHLTGRVHYEVFPHKYP